MSTSDPFNLARFREAQETVFDAALSELQSGRKRTHWMWFIFPQFRGLGQSSTAQLYGIRSIEEARAYLRDPHLGERLHSATAATLTLQGHTALAVFGTPDDLKFRSSMTLFSVAKASSTSLFEAALRKYFAGKPDQRTLDLLESARSGSG